MYINQIKIKNILGLQEFEFNAGQFNEITGKNGVGKTSILEAIKSVFKSGNDATLITKGADEGEVVLVLDDGTQINKTFSNGKATTKVFDADGLKMAKPTPFLDSIADLISINPVTFLTADKKDRTNILLESMPLKVSQTDLQNAISAEIMPEVRMDIENRHAFEVFEIYHKALYDARTAENRSLKQTTNTINELESNLVHNDIPKDAKIQDILANLEHSQLNMQSKLNQYKTEFLNAKNSKINEANTIKNSKIEHIENEYQQQLALLQKKRDDKKELLMKEFNDIVIEANLEHDKLLNEKKSKFDEKYTSLTQDIAKYRAMLQNQAIYEQQYEYIQKLKTEQELYKFRADSLTQALENITQLKHNLMKNLPIDGLEIIDGLIYRNGVLFDRLNTAQKVEIAVELAKLRAGELPIMCVDGIELLDEDAYNEFKNKYKDIQMFITKVSNENLKINN